METKRWPWPSAATWGLTLVTLGLLAWDLSGALASREGARGEGVSVTVGGVEREALGRTPEASPPGPRVVEGRLPTRVVVAAAGIDAPVEEVGIVLVDGEPQWESVWRAAGHLITSALPGQPGNVVLAGHVSVADRRNRAVFATLDRVRRGDVIEVYAGDRLYRYRVTEILVVDPTATWVLKSQPVPTVTLITCTRDFAHRLVVRGRLES